jgi:hypothetical protein
MTVAELIAKLREMPQNMIVDMYSDLDGWDDIHFVQTFPTEGRIRLSAHDQQPLIDALIEGQRRKAR